jgi:hypothetical protein
MGTGLRLYEEEGITGVEFPVGRRFIDMLAVDKVRRRNGSSAGLVFSATLCASHTDARSGSPDPDQAWEAPRSGFRFIFVIESGGSARRIASNGRSRPRLLAGKVSRTITNSRSVRRITRARCSGVKPCGPCEVAFLRRTMYSSILTRSRITVTAVIGGSISMGTVSLIAAILRSFKARRNHTGP